MRPVLVTTALLLSTAVFSLVLADLPVFTKDLFDFSEKKKYIVAPIYILGLANRLRTVSSLYAIAKRSDRKLIIIWKPNSDCNAEFDELFESWTSDISVARWNNEMTYESALEQIKLIHEYYGNINVLFQTPRKFFVDLSFNISTRSMKSADLVFFWTASSHSPENLDCSEYMKLKHNFYVSLRPVQSIRSMLQQISSASGVNFYPNDVEDLARRKLFVGVHVRMHDAAYDWAVVTPSVENLHKDSERSLFDTARTFSESTPVPVVIEAMTLIEQRFSSVVFIVVSNSNEVKRELVEHFTSDRIVTTLSSLDEMNISRSKKIGMELALLDFYLLGLGSDIILHSKGSTYGIEASYLSPRSPRPVIDISILDSKFYAHSLPAFVYKNDARLRYCGIDDFYNARLDQLNDSQKRICYYDDVLEDSTHRVLCSYLQRLDKCEAESVKWGLPNLYCLKGSNAKEVFDEDVCTREKMFSARSNEHEWRSICILADNRGY